LIGDFFQLPPVLNKPLYTIDVSSLKQDELHGRNAYRSFTHSVFLTTIQRQARDDQASFRKALLELREAKVSAESWELLSSRCAVRLFRWEQESFESVVRIYPTKEQVDAYNHEHMVGLNSPAFNVIASRALVPRRPSHRTLATCPNLSLSAWVVVSC
jgi:ATP-dependent DNA helicase PIF1